MQGDKSPTKTTLERLQDERWRLMNYCPQNAWEAGAVRDKVDAIDRVLRAAGIGMIDGIPQRNTRTGEFYTQIEVDKIMGLPDPTDFGETAGQTPKSRTTKYRLLVYGLDDKLVLALPLSDDQACALGDALHLDGLDGIGLLGEHPVPHVHFEVCDA